MADDVVQDVIHVAEKVKKRMFRAVYDAEAMFPSQPSHHITAWDGTVM